MGASSSIAYHTDGGRVIPIRRFLAGTDFDGKNPNRPGWLGEEGLSEREIAALDPELYNLGLILWPYVDFDADCDEVRRAAAVLMPPTGVLFGRGERLDAHRLYRCTGEPLPVKPYNDPAAPIGASRRLGELRGRGGQTVIPPSVHKSGERVAYLRADEAAVCAAEALARAADWTMAAALLGRYWREGVRHEAATALAGWLARAGVGEAEAQRFVRAVGAAGLDEESRHDTVALTYRKRLAGTEELTGFARLATLLPRAAVATAGKWLGLRTLEVLEAPRAADGEGAFPENETENAELLRGRMGDGVRYVAVHREFYVERGGIWVPDAALLVDQEALAMGRALKARALAEAELPEKAIARRLAHARQALSAAGTTATMRQLGRLAGVSVAHDAWDARKELIACRDGVVDLRTGALLPHDRELLITKRAEVGWFRGVPDEKDDLGHWNHYLQSSFVDRDGAPSMEKILFLQRWLGYCLTGETREQKFLAMMGQARSGKGTLARLLGQVILKDFCKVATASVFLEGAERRHSTEVAELYGSRIVWASEFKADGAIAVETIKRMTGEDGITARKLNRDNFTFYPQFKINLLTNESPRIEEGGDAFWARILRLDFHRRFLAEATECRPGSLTWPIDTQLDEKLAGERDAIFRWMVEGAMWWYANGASGGSGLDVPEVVRAAGQEMRVNQDVLAAFVLHSCLPAEDGGDPVETVFEAWNAYRFQTREREIPQRQFLAEMALRGHEVERERLGRAGLWFRTLRVKL